MVAGDTAIEDPELAARLALSDAAFERYMGELVGQVGSREFDAAALKRALGYPWRRPDHSYLLAGGEVGAVGARPERFLAGRTPLLAIGSNAAPETLRRKLAHFRRREDRDVLAIAGWLHDFDIGPSAHLAAYGALPATLLASSGTAVRCAILWLTPRQFTQLAWSELSYSLGRVARRFEADEPEFEVREVIAFVSRFGSFAPGGEPLALAAVRARGRAAAPLTQHELLARAAPLVLGPGATGEQLVRAALEDYARTWRRTLQGLRPHRLPLAPSAWTPLIPSKG